MCSVWLFVFTLRAQYSNTIIISGYGWLTVFLWKQAIFKSKSFHCLQTQFPEVYVYTTAHDFALMHRDKESQNARFFFNLILIDMHTHSKCQTSEIQHITEFSARKKNGISKAETPRVCIIIRESAPHEIENINIRRRE